METIGTEMFKNVSSTAGDIARSGYDLPVYGLEDGTFYILHTMAISCLSISVTCAMTTLIVSCHVHSHTKFFTNWQKRDRFIVYTAIGDILYSGVHLADHLHVLITKDHVHPKGVCVFYGFVVITAVITQNLLANVIAINAFALLYFGYNLNFGSRDWKLLLWIFGVPLVCTVVSAALDKFGPMGAFCSFDGVVGLSFNLAFTAMPTIVLLPTNCTLYVLIWAKLVHQTKAIRATVGRMSAGQLASHRAVKSMMLIVLAYAIQWWSTSLYSIWGVIDSNIPQFVVTVVVIFVNLGGAINFVVFVIIRRKAAKHEARETNDSCVSMRAHPVAATEVR